MQNVEGLVRFFEKAGVRWIFGVPSSPVLPLIESLRLSPVEFVLTTSEASAGFMASTVGHLTGTPGICVSTLGPGATNLATGVGCAWLDRSPLLAITCNVSTPYLNRRTQMRIDHHALFKPLTKATWPLRPNRVAESLREAMALACFEPPGPVHLDFPEDVALAETTENFHPTAKKNVLPQISSDLTEKVATALLQSHKPLVVTGLTFTRCLNQNQLLGFIEKQSLPFASTLHAKGYLPESHPNWIGVLERARRSDMRALVQSCDLILAIGYDPVEINYEEWAGKTPVIHISTEPAEENLKIRLIENYAGDLNSAIRQLGEIPPQSNNWSHSEWEEHRHTLDRSLRPQSNQMSPHHVVDILRERLPKDGILVYDVGAHTHQIATQWRTDVPATCLSTNGWSSMGFGMPAAYAAKLVHPNLPVVAMVGDGCFQITAGELSLAKRLSLAVPTIVLKDGWLSLIKVKQERRGYGISGVFLGEPGPTPKQYFGVPARSAQNKAEFAKVLDWALRLKGPSVIEAFTDVRPYSKTVYD